MTERYVMTIAVYISFLSIAGKVLAGIILNRLGRSICDMVFAVRQLQEKYQEQYKDFYLVFVELPKAFNMVKQGQWRILAKFAKTRSLL